MVEWPNAPEEEGSICSLSPGEGPDLDLLSLGANFHATLRNINLMRAVCFCQIVPKQLPKIHPENSRKS